MFTRVLGQSVVIADVPFCAESAEYFSTADVVEGGLTTVSPHLPDVSTPTDVGVSPVQSSGASERPMKVAASPSHFSVTFYRHAAAEFRVASCYRRRAESIVSVVAPSGRSTSTGIRRHSL